MRSGAERHQCRAVHQDLGFSQVPKPLIPKPSIPSQMGQALAMELQKVCDLPCATPYTLHPTPYTLNPTTYALHPMPYTLHHTP